MGIHNHPSRMCMLRTFSATFALSPLKAPPIPLYLETLTAQPRIATLLGDLTPIISETQKLQTPRCEIFLPKAEHSFNDLSSN